jgi:hypothetical protein
VGEEPNHATAARKPSPLKIIQYSLRPTKSSQNKLASVLFVSRSKSVLKIKRDYKLACVLYFVLGKTPNIMEL